jgi:hypothetical protein
MKTKTSLAQSEAPTTRKELEDYSQQVALRLMDWYDKNQEFRDETDEGRGKTGLIYRCAGSVSLLLLANTFPKVAGEPRWKNIVLKEFDLVRIHVKEKGFDASPLIDSEKTKDSFSPSAATQYHYLDSVSWTLSFAILMRLTHRADLINLDNPKTLAIREMIQNTLQIICDSACEKGGWGFTSGCKQPDLYFSYAISEALADFGDYVMGESKEEGIAEPDEEFIDSLGGRDGHLIKSVTAVRKRTCEWLIADCLNKLGQETRLSEEESSKEVDDPIDAIMANHLGLYATYFAIDMLIVSNADLSFPHDAHRILQKLEHAIYLSRIRFDKAYEDKGWWNNPSFSSWMLQWEKSHPAFPRVRSLAMPNEPGLAPLSLRCNVLYTYYLSQGRDKKIDELLNVVHNEAKVETGLWDRESFSLMITERAIESLVDYADYLKKFPRAEQAAGVVSTSECSFRDAVALAVREYCESDAGRAVLLGGPGGVINAAQTMGDDEIADRMQSVFRQCANVFNEQKSGRRKDRSAYTFLNEAFYPFLVALFADRICSAAVKEDLTHKDVTTELKDHEKQLLAAFGSWLKDKPAAGLGVLFNYVRDKAGSEYQQSTEP